MTDIDEFEAAEKAAMAKAERLYKAIVYTVGLTVVVAVIAMLLSLLARHCERTPQSQTAIICQQMINASKKRGVK